MGLEGILKKGACVLALSGALLLNEGCATYPQEGKNYRKHDINAQIANNGTYGYIQAGVGGLTAVGAISAFVSGSNYGKKSKEKGDEYDVLRKDALNQCVGFAAISATLIGEAVKCIGAKSDWEDLLEDYDKKRDAESGNIGHGFSLTNNARLEVGYNLLNLKNNFINQEGLYIKLGIDF